MNAVIDLLSEGQSGFALSMEAVAARAGVGKATIYRRWPNKEAMLIDAVGTMKGPPVQPPGESLRGDLIALVSANRGKRMEIYGKVTACLIPDLLRDEELRAAFGAVMEPRRDLMRNVLRRGVESGELRADLDIELSLLMLQAPGMVQNWFRWNPNIPHEGLAEKLVDNFLRGAAA
ncbi:TetR/AcrR family transcriptional regulator [Actinoplanes sp. NPDC049265]|uniref:TetR/AcrR family transcriptional regulator n=1 Tax=Actinoplanes sp. NPDC049265 TaxID=3363902 RepID=UPI00371F89C0